MASSIAFSPAHGAETLLSAASQTAATMQSTMARGKTDVPAKAKAQAQDFEAVFLQTMFSQMFTGVDGDGPVGGSQGVGVWRSFLTQEYAKSFAQQGGIGLADHVYRSLMAQQETRAAR